MSEYDATIRDHYASVAQSDGLAATSTMADLLIRERETAAIVQFVGLTTGGLGTVADFGCGNGYTLEVLAAAFPQLDLHGFEYTPELRQLAEERLRNARASVSPGDIRDPGFCGGRQFDAVIVQRVIINLLDRADQALALDNIVAAVKPGGHVLFIECFEEPLDDLNEAREEFDLPPIGPAQHNLYLRNGFYEHGDLAPFDHSDWQFPPNVLSTHYFVSRAFDPGLMRGKPFKRNSQVQRFFSMALPPAIGNFAPLMIHAFVRSTRS